jgi:transcriptional regulator with XRE-family HTH domain
MNKLNPSDSFGHRLAKLRKSKGLTQTQIGEKIGVSKRIVSYYEGQTQYPPAHLIVPLAKALQVSIDELFGLKSSDFVDPQNAALWRKLKKAEELSSKDKKSLLDFIDALLIRSKTKK